jgi:hypothetical protein
LGLQQAGDTAVYSIEDSREDNCQDGLFPLPLDREANTRQTDAERSGRDRIGNQRA